MGHKPDGTIVTKVDRVKEFLVHANVSCETIGDPWNQGFVIGLHFAEFISDEEFEQLEHFIDGGWYDEVATIGDRQAK